MTRRSVLRISTASLCAASALGALSPSSAAPVAPVALTGVVTTDGSAPVSLSAVIWPDAEALEALPVGAAVPLLNVDAIEVTGNRYTVRVDPSRLPADYVGESGVDIQVEAHAELQPADAYSETVKNTPAGWSRSAAARGLRERLGGEHRDTPGNLHIGTSDPSATARPATLRVLGGLASGGAGGGIMASSAGSLSLEEPICSTIKTDVILDKSAKISDVMPATNYMTGRVTYTIGSSHELGVGIKSHDGIASEGGTITRSSSESVTPAWRGYDHTARTIWRYREYKSTCTGRITARAESHEGGYLTPTRSRPSYTNCLRYSPQEKWERETNLAYTYQAGVEIYGIGVNTQSGYNQSVRLQYAFPERSRWLCGNDANPAQAKLVAGYANDQ